MKCMLLSNRNMKCKLRLASDMFNPTSLPRCLWSKYILWWALLITGPKPSKWNWCISATIHELQHMCVNGLEIYDASQNETFHMHIAILWTVCHFHHMQPYLVGALIEYACHRCMEDTCYELDNSHKHVSTRHCRFLESGYHFRCDKRSWGNWGAKCTKNCL